MVIISLLCVCFRSSPPSDVNSVTSLIYDCIASGGGGNFVLSTSLLGYSDSSAAAAAMVEDGYGVFYTIQPEV